MANAKTFSDQKPDLSGELRCPTNVNQAVVEGGEARMDCHPESWSIGRLWREKNDLLLDPPYQRQPGIWSKPKKQLFLDSLFNGFDTPKIYFHNIKSDKSSPEKYAIVDGLQRLTTIWEFMNRVLPLDGSFTLDPEKQGDPPNPTGGMKYDNLSEDWQQLFRDIQLTVTVIEDADTNDIEDLFFRLNNGQALVAAEQRTAIGGDMVSLIKEVAEDDFFTKHVRFANKRQQHREAAAKLLRISGRTLGGDDHFGDLKKRHLDDMAREGKTLTSKREKGLKKHTSQVLSRMTRVFPDKPDHRLAAQASVPLYFIFVDLVFDRYGHPKLVGLVDEFIQNFVDALKENRSTDEDDRDPSLSEYDLHNQQGTNDAGSLRTRSEIMIAFLLRWNPEITLKDENRLFSESEKRALWLVADGVCQAPGCGQRLPSWTTGEADHVNQWAAGGETTIKNGRILCKPCNASLGKHLT